MRLGSSTLRAIWQNADTGLRDVGPHVENTGQIQLQITEITSSPR